MKFTLFSASYLCLLQIIIKTNAQLSPSYRKLHSTVLVENKLYVFGGFNDAILKPENEVNYNKSPDDRFFYLDVANSFVTSDLPWKAIPDNAKNLPLGSLSSIATGGVAASIGGYNDTIYFFNNERDNITSPIHSYNSPNNVWNTQIFSGDRPIGRNQMRVITDNIGKIYLLTGFDFTVQGVTRSNGMYVCDTLQIICTIKFGIPLSRLGYGVTLLPNGMLVFMGGADRNYAPISDGFNVVFLYDTNNDKWDSKITNGSIPPSDVGITTVSGLNGNKIILFGGNNGDNFSLYVLDTTSYEWSIPRTRGKTPVFKRGEHTANVVGKYMVVAFGSNGVIQSKYRSSGESDVLLLDISDDSEYIWTTSFDPTPLSASPAPVISPESKPKDTNKGIIIGSVIGSIILVSILSIGVFWFIKRRKNATKAIPTGGTTTGEIMSIPSDHELSHGKNRI